ncbi:MAG: MFS transporter [Chloroflexota bacterium]
MPAISSALMSRSTRDPSVSDSPPGSRWRRLLMHAVIDVRPLRRHRDFRLLFLGRLISFFGSMITMVALPYQVYQLTHSSLAVGILGLFEIVPILGLAFLGGALADAHDRRRMVQITELSLTLLSAVLMANALLPRPQLWLLYLIATLMAGLDSLQRPSLDALLPRLVDRDELTAAGALSSLQSTAGQILGPALAGVFIAVIGLPATFGLDVATFFVSLLALRLMRAVPPAAGAEKPSLNRVLEGLRYARSRQELMGTYLVDMAAMFFGMPMALFPALATHYGGASVLGLLYAAPGAGAFLITVTSGWSNRVHRHGRAVVVAAICWGLAITGFGLSKSLILALIFLGLAGGADMVSGLFRSAIWNQTIPDALRGRLASIELISYSSGPTLGNLEAGGVASGFGLETAIVSGGILCVLSAGLLGLSLPRFMRYDNTEHRDERAGDTSV